MINTLKIAQIDFDGLRSNYGLPGNYANLGEIFSLVLVPYIYAFAGSFLLLYLIFGGFRYMFAKGDPKALQGAKAHITNAIIGFVIVFASFWIVQFVGLLLGLTQFNAIF